MSPTPIDIPFHVILNTLDIPLIAVDAQGLAAFATPAFCALFDLDGRDVHGARLDTLVPDVQPDAATPQTHTCASGERFTVTATPIDMDGSRAGTLLAFLPHETDVRNTPEYRRLAEYLEAIFHSSSDGIWVTDGKGTVVDVNTASENLNDIRARDVIGKSVTDLVKSGDIDKSATLEVLKKKRRISILQEVQRTKRHLIVTGTPSLDENGDIRLVVLNERDITDLNDLRATLAQTRKAKEKVEEQLTGLSLMELKKGHVVAESPAMRKAMATAQKLAQFETSEILLMGDSGTGKGLLAKFIHDSSPRRGKPFIQINCATLPETLFEAELFGYEAGAFTGAAEKGKSGLLELAAGGTFFLDEVGEIPLDMQAKLLKCLDDHEYYPLGAGRAKRVDCVIVAATNRDLETLVEAKQFRRDLLYRLNTFTVRIPPLRQRPEDIFELVNHYLRQFNAAYRTDKRIGPAGMQRLQAHTFPGNVRELIGMLKKAVVICEEDSLDEYLEDLLSAEADDTVTRTMPEEVARLERRMLRQAMAASKNTREMADCLGVSQPTVVRKLQRYRLRRTDS